ncbi:PHD finger protein 24 [Magallana gigas]|uniref:PHD finger protein 24 n=1 Tax=Magallana gigas TaxID=29159 RepID=UPI0005C34DA9|eukprot:XP_011449914.1 PREDICTED: PHD finger protein 24 [Crassostrea gigas]
MESSHTKWSSASSSILFIGSLVQHCRKNLEVLQTRRQSNHELKDFIKDMKEQTREISTELEKEGPGDHRWLIRRGSETRLTPCSIPKAKKVSDDVYCEVCQCRFRKADRQYPCRICEGVFHRDCVLGITDVHPSHASTIERASSKIGWSCPACDDLSLLLSEDELNQIIQTFDEEIHPKGDQISFEEFLAFKSVHGDTTEEDVERLRLEFRLVDTDANGRIDWWEFLTYQAKMKLFSRNQDELVNLLTAKEIEAAESAFSHLKLNTSGRVSPGESKRVLSEWYRLLDSHGEQREMLDHYASLAATRIMALDDTPPGSISWNDFLKGQAKYIIGARPNIIKI